MKCTSQQFDSSVLLDHQSLVRNSNQCPLIYLKQSIARLAYRVNKTFTIHIEKCNQLLNVNSCRLYNRRKQFSLTELNPILVRPNNKTDLCLLKCSFQWSSFNNIHQLSFDQPLYLHLSIQFSNKTILMIPHTRITMYRCQHMAFTCTSCLQLDPSYDCIWCNNMCMSKNQSESCSVNRQCLLPIIQTVEPLILPMNGGTLVTITGKNFDQVELSIHIADILCQLIEEECSHDK